MLWFTEVSSACQFEVRAMKVGEGRPIRARRLFTLNGSNEILSTTFEDCGAKLGNRTLVLGPEPGVLEKMQNYRARLCVLNEAISYAVEGLTSRSRASHNYSGPGPPVDSPRR